MRDLTKSRSYSVTWQAKARLLNNQSTRLPGLGRWRYRGQVAWANPKDYRIQNWKP